MGWTGPARKNGDFQTLPVAAAKRKADTALNAKPPRTCERGNMFISRAKTGFGGIITVSAVLFVTQLIQGIQAFAL